MTALRFCLRLSCWLSCVHAAYPLAAVAQDPVIKPSTTVDTLQQRLPAPSSVSATQLPDGRIAVTWTPVIGAVRYQITRSVPPDAARVLPDTPTKSPFIDSAVQLGRTYYYIVAAYNESQTLGLKAGSPPITATIPLGGTTTTPTISTTTTSSTSAMRADFISPNRVHLTWTPPTVSVSDIFGGGSTSVVVQRLVTGSTGTQALNIARVPLSAASFDDSFDPRGVLRVVYNLMADGRPDPLMTSNVVSLPTPDPGPSTDTETSSGTSSTTSAALATGSTTFTAAPAVALKAGANLPVGSVGGTGAQWISMNPSVATVDTAGVVTGRAAGKTQVVALISGSDGSLRVTSVPVTVTP